MPSAFISHSSPDDRYVTEFEQLVRSLGYDDVFSDHHSVPPDADFWAAIEASILKCDAFVVVLSHASVKSYWVDREVEFARANGKRVIPVRIDDCTLPASFDGRDIVELRPGQGDRVKIAPSRILRHAPDRLFGRGRWLKLLDATWAARDRINLYSIVAWGGVGKTSLVAHWVNGRMAKAGWPEVERYFDWSFYSQGTREAAQTSADFFIDAALKFFGDPDPTAGTPWDRGTRLATLVQKHRTLLVLDGVEPLQYPPNTPQEGELKDQALTALLQSLAAHNPGLCIVTTRVPLKNIGTFLGATAKERNLTRLYKHAAVAYLRHLKLVGSDAELEAAWRDTNGHALTLQLLGRFLADAHGGDIRKRDEIDWTEAEEERDHRSAFKVMLAYETWLASAGPDRQRDLQVLRLTGLFDRPADPGCLKALRAEPPIPGLTEPLTDTQWNRALKDLDRLDLITLTETDEGTAIDAHPLVREYFATKLKTDHPDAFKQAHSRLFDHLCNTTEPRPDTLAGLQPLYQAITHGCLADRHQETSEDVFYDRIRRGNEGFSQRKLGAIGPDLAAIASFFDQPWTHISPNLTPTHQAWLLNEAAYCLRALGRLAEALEPMRIGMDRRVEQSDWTNAAISAGNLSELQLTLGHLPEAVADAVRAIDFADRSGDDFQRMSMRTTAADALHQSGDRPAAATRFAKARQMQTQRQPQFPLLYSVQGFQYTDLLLAPAERAAWQSRPTPEAQAAITEAQRSASQTLDWAETHNLALLTISMDHLTLARATLYHTLLQPTPPPDNPNLQSALDILRQASALNHLPRALLTAAHHHAAVLNDHATAHNLLDEAGHIARRGPMPLYLADVHLHRARLFKDKAELKQARTLIDKHGYGRRKEELEDAEAASKNW